MQCLLRHLGKTGVLRAQVDKQAIEHSREHPLATGLAETAVRMTTPQRRSAPSH